MKRSSLAKRRLYRFSLYGAAIFGSLGFFAGVTICLHYRLPIPPLFTTEIGALLGGCLGALFGMLEPPTWHPKSPDPDEPWETYRAS